ncbi:TPA: hypothetical protein DCQ44_00090, partial [Candidatus Taylorbacteria bacterium]|nr:hypothetical protein [Candidatus Taylorbacteria bacterium]
MNRYDHKEIEKKWQDKWEEAKVFEASDTSEKPKFFALIEFPFASGEGMHMGHLRSNTAMDVISRKRRAEGYNVLYPIGWDAFGLPTENYAIKTGKQPSVITKDNTDNFRLQLKRAGFSFDWTREVNTSDPSYYKWTQWIFLQFFKKGLAYKKKMSINWCPKDKIGLANEEVMNGLCERCGTAVEKRDKEQWMLAITKYADRLDKDLDTVNYLENIKTQQRNWIGRSEGAEISFKVIFEGGQQSGLIPVFTTRADTLFGVTYMVLSPEHPWVTLAVDENHKGVIKNVEEVRTYIAEAKKKDEITRTDAGKVKTGVELKGVKAVNPATGEEIPMFVADYVLAHYGTGAVMAVPAHDERDFEFAKKYNLSIKKVVEPVFIQETEPGKVRKDLPVEEREAIIAIVKHWSEDKYIGLKWKEVAWGTFITGGIEEGQTAEEAAKMEILEETGFLHPKLVADFGILHGKFYHVPKKVNRFAHASTLLFRLEDDQQKEVLSEEKAKHEVVWLSRAELQKFLTPATHFRALDILNGIEFYS